MRFLFGCALLAGLFNASDVPANTASDKAEEAAPYLIEFLGHRYRVDAYHQIGQWERLLDDLDAFGTAVSMKGKKAKDYDAVPLQNLLNAYRLEVGHVVNKWCPDVGDLCDRVERVARAYTDFNFCRNFNNWLMLSACRTNMINDYAGAHLALLP